MFVGITPFVIALLLKLGILSLSVIDEDKLILGYAVIISVFVSGTHWGISLKSCYLFGLVGSNIDVYSGK